jgi:hypothetical protein
LSTIELIGELMKLLADSLESDAFNFMSLDKDFDTYD